MVRLRVILPFYCHYDDGMKIRPLLAIKFGRHRFMFEADLWRRAAGPARAILSYSNWSRFLPNTTALGRFLLSTAGKLEIIS